MKRCGLWLAALACLVMFAGASAFAYNEAPVLRALVEEGQLPPVESRLPEEPEVIECHTEVGEYGGTWRRAFLGPSDMSSLGRLTYDPLVRWNQDASAVVRNVAKDWTVSDDGKVFTFYLRKGMRWSDGEPFTADDLVFWYQDILMNKELTPSFPEWLTINGKPAQMEKLDEYTFQIVFPEPYGLFVQRLATFGTEIFYPKHYGRKYHINYADPNELNRMVKEAGFDYWYQLFRRKLDQWVTVGRPVLSAWKIETPNTQQHFILKRNPYYWKVDTAGNQLPYIDTMLNELVQNAEVINLKAVAGELDMQLRHIDVANLPVLKEGESTGKYRVILWKPALGADVGIMPNQNQKDPVLRSLFRDKEFRQALSVAINREEINELVYLGLGEARQATVIPECPFYEDEFATAWAQYDPELGNRMLDEMGLTRRNSAGYRLRPDGKTLSVTIEIPAGIFGPWVKVSELIKEYWEALGVRTTIQVYERALWTERSMGVEPEVLVWNVDRSLTPLSHPYWWIPQTSYSYAPLWGQWYESRGQKGEEPVPQMKRVMEMYDLAKGTTDEDKRVEYGKEMMRLHAENVWVIGTVGLVPGAMSVGVVKDCFHNVPDVALTDVLQNSPGNTHPEQYYMTVQ